MLLANSSTLIARVLAVGSREDAVGEHGFRHQYLDKRYTLEISKAEIHIIALVFQRLFEIHKGCKMDDSSLAEIIRIEEKERNFEGAIARLIGIVQEDPTCLEAYIHLAADSGILKRFRQAEYYARLALKLNPESGRARYYLACALRDQDCLNDASVEMERALATLKREVYAGSFTSGVGINLPLVGWGAKVEQDAVNLRLTMQLQRTRKPSTAREVPNFTTLPGGIKTYRNDRHGFEIDIPEDWSASDDAEIVERVLGPIPLTDPHDSFQFGRRDEAFNFVINPLCLEPSLEDTEFEFTIYAQDHAFHDLKFGRITVGNREHVCAHYRIEDQLGIRWNKKYMIVFGGTEYSITGTCNTAECFANREQSWDTIVKSFRLLVALDDSDQDTYQNYRLLTQRREFNEQRLFMRNVAGTLYARAFEAAETKNYSKARTLLEQCLRENPDHTLAHKEMVAVLKKLGDRRGALRHRQEVKRLDPSDYGSRLDLVELLAGCGSRKEALREVDELITLRPDASQPQKLKTSLLNDTGPHHQLKFILAIVYFLLVDLAAFSGGIVQQAPWLAGFLCLPAANYLNLSGRWVGLTKKSSDWLTVALSFLTLAILVLKDGLNPILFILFFCLVFPIMADNALRD